MAKKDREALNEGLDAVLGAPGLDLMGDIIRGDRRRTGRPDDLPAPAPLPASPRGEGDEGADADPVHAPTGEAVDYDVMTSSNTIGHYDTPTVGQADNEDLGQADFEADPKTTGLPDKRADGQTDRTTRGGGAVERKARGRAAKTQAKAEAKAGPEETPRGREETVRARSEEAAKMAKSPTMTVTLRLPKEMNDWLDEYVHRSWPQRIKKQELVVEALRLLVARRGRAGEPLIPTELLAEEE